MRLLLFDACSLKPAPVSLSRRPGHCASAKQVEMQMIDGLAAVFAGIYDHTIAFAEAIFSGEFGCDEHQVTDQVMLFVCLVERPDVLSRNDEQMGWRLRRDVCERKDTVILVNGL